ncbi:MAG: YihY/virulence factor BrkB family protein [Actinomycetota bacterium]|nr:YihY/virulence factor BrkB family protein [Actinomycetota bacterium]
MKADNVSVLAGGVAFYLMLSLFPFAIAALSVYGLAADPDDVTELVQQIQGTVPDSVVRLLEDQLSAIAESSRGSLTFGLVGSVLFALWSASKGAGALIKATNVAFDERETRGFLRLRALALGLTLAFLVVIVLSVALIAVVPRLLAETPFVTAFSLLRWPALAVVAITGLAALYRYAPDRDEPRWQWVSLGAVLATVLWLAGSSLFSLYADNFGNFNETYGSLSAVIVLLLWLSLTAFVILLGAEINAETEHQTVRDSTEGPEQPLGERGAHPADTVGERIAAE